MKGRIWTRAARRYWDSRKMVLVVLGSLCLADHRGAVAGAPPLPSAPGFLSCSWQFDTTNLPSVRGFAPKAASGLELVTSFSSNAVRIAGTSAVLQYREVETNGLTNIVCQNGTIFVWIKPAWTSASGGGSGPGAYGRIIELGGFTTNASYGWWSAYVDSGGSYLFFSGQSNGSTATYVTNAIQWTSNQWQFLALTYSPTNSAVYLNGQLTASGGGVTLWPGSEVRTNGFTLGGDATGANLTQGTFDMLMSFSYPLSASFVSNYYQAVYQRYFAGGGGGGGEGGGGPLGPESENLRILGPAFQSTNTLLTITGGIAQVWYDFFRATSVTGISVTNSLWDWLGQGLNEQTYAFPNQPQPNAFYVLGTPQDLDGDGLTDAYETLTSKTLHLNSDTDGDGLADGLEWLISPTAPFTPSPIPTLGNLPLNRCPLP